MSVDSDRRRRRRGGGAAGAAGGVKISGTAGGGPAGGVKISGTAGGGPAALVGGAALGTAAPPLPRFGPAPLPRFGLLHNLHRCRPLASKKYIERSSPTGGIAPNECEDAPEAARFYIATDACMFMCMRMRAHVLPSL